MSSANHTPSLPALLAEAQAGRRSEAVPTPPDLLSCTIIITFFSFLSISSIKIAKSIYNLIGENYSVLENFYVLIETL